MRQRAVSARQVLVSHPWAIGLLESRIAIGPAALPYYDSVIGSLRAGGFSAEMAAHAFSGLDSCVYGSSSRRTACRSTPPSRLRKWRKPVLDGLEIHRDGVSA